MCSVRLLDLIILYGLSVCMNWGILALSDTHHREFSFTAEGKWIAFKYASQRQVSKIQRVS